MKFSELQRLQRREGITVLSADERIEQLEARLRTITKERDALRAKVAEMEKQEPLDAGSDVFRSAFEAALKAGNWPATRQGDGYRSPSTQIAWRIAFSTVNRLKLYALPGAQTQPAPSVPDDWLRAINEALVVAHVGVANESDTYEQAKAKLDSLLGFHVDAATDPAVNGGWKLVPRPPTPTMVKAGLESSHVLNVHRVLACYDAMIDAAPEVKP